MGYVQFMKNFHLGDKNEVTAVRLISGSWAQKRIIPTFRHGVRRVHEKFSPSRFERGNGF